MNILQVAWMMLITAAMILDAWLINVIVKGRLAMINASRNHGDAIIGNKSIVTAWGALALVSSLGFLIVLWAYFPYSPWYGTGSATVMFLIIHSWAFSGFSFSGVHHNWCALMYPPEENTGTAPVSAKLAKPA